MRSHSELEAFGRTLRVSSLDRVLWPLANFTKRDLLDYLSAIAPTMLPHLKGRPMTLARFPTGVEGRGWFQTNCPNGRPDWLRVREVPGKNGQRFQYALLEEPAAILWAANQGALEFHPAQEPGVLVVDLDPGEPAGLVECCEVALLLRERCGPGAVVKTSGLAGLHVFVPMPDRAKLAEAGDGFAALKQRARQIAEELAQQHPDRITAKMLRSLRPGKVFIDWGQNDETKSMAAAYSPRAAPYPFISTPIAWAEVEEAAKTRDARGLRFLPREVLARVEKHGDLFRI
ncbi:MAG TPA: ATP-dependent DNA ligase [Myxococcales bacterium]|jgi:bifunctional non-homologous end joining protein LigD